MPKKRRERSWIEAIEIVLNASGEAMHYKEIAEEIVDKKLKRNVGATPYATVAATITRALSGDDPPFQRVGRGMYMLRGMVSKKNLQSQEDEDETGIITSFGMFWRRDLVYWGPNPRLLGVQQLGAKSVDFCNQRGIYLLYDRREIIYVGRTTDRPMGRRLYEHTNDRLATRWNLFSWFGLLPVTEEGELGEMPDNYRADKLIPTLESVLIEALEPRQNRKRGDEFSAVEYFQKEDPKIETEKKRALLEKLVNKIDKI